MTETNGKRRKFTDSPEVQEQIKRMKAKGAIPKDITDEQIEEQIKLFKEGIALNQHLIIPNDFTPGTPGFDLLMHLLAHFVIMEGPLSLVALMANILNEANRAAHDQRNPKLSDDVLAEFQDASDEVEKAYQLLALKHDGLVDKGRGS